MFIIRRHLTRRSLYGSRLYKIKSSTFVWYRVLRTIVGAGFPANFFVDVFTWCIWKAKRNRWHTTMTARINYNNRAKIYPETVSSINRIIESYDKGVMLFDIQTYSGRSKGKNYVTELLARPYLPLEHVMYRENRIQELQDNISSFDKLSYEEFVRKNLCKIKRPQKI